jgi:hypothetical protein
MISGFGVVHEYEGDEISKGFRSAVLGEKPLKLVSHTHTHTPVHHNAHDGVDYGMGDKLKSAPTQTVHRATYSREGSWALKPYKRTETTASVNGYKRTKVTDTGIKYTGKAKAAAGGAVAVGAAGAAAGVHATKRRKRS